MPEKEDKKSRRPKRLTAQKKFQLYLETRDPNAPVGEVLRRYGLHLADLRAIEETVEKSAIAGLKVRSGNKAKSKDVTPEAYDRLARELREKEKALADLSVEHQLLKKMERLGLWTKKKDK